MDCSLIYNDFFTYTLRNKFKNSSSSIKNFGTVNNNNNNYGLTQWLCHHALSKPVRLK